MGAWMHCYCAQNANSYSIETMGSASYKVRAVIHLLNKFSNRPMFILFRLPCSEIRLISTASRVYNVEFVYLGSPCDYVSLVT